MHDVKSDGAAVLENAKYNQDQPHVTGQSHDLAGAYTIAMDFEIVGEVKDAETITINLSIRESADLRARFGGRRWRKRKGAAMVRMQNGRMHRVELH